MSRVPKLIVILGPTASGKTALALKLAKKFNGEIVSADSRQIYRGMDIGTAKPLLSQKSKIKNQKYKSKLKSKELKNLYYGEVNGIRHWLLDVVDPDEEFSLAEYKKLAVAAIYDILKRGKAPFLVGGTGLYIQSVVDNLEIPVVPPNKKLRAQFEKELKQASFTSHKISYKNCDRNFCKIFTREQVIEKWYKKLLKLDPEAIHIVDPKNPRRIIRAIEVCLATHQPFSRLRKKGEPLFDVLQIGIDVPRKILYERIDRRVDWMVKHGLVLETKNLLKKYNPSLPSMSGIGYKEIGDYLRGEISLSKAVERIKYRTHAYARRQMTWFKRDKRIIWVRSNKESERKIIKWLNE